MRCPKCDGDTNVYDSRPRENGHTVYRRRRCLECLHEFVTDERATKLGPNHRWRE